MNDPRYMSIPELSKLEEYEPVVSWKAGENEHGDVIASRFKRLFPTNIAGIVFWSDEDGSWTTVQDEDGTWKKKKMASP